MFNIMKFFKKTDKIDKADKEEKVVDDKQLVFSRAEHEAILNAEKVKYQETLAYHSEILLSELKVAENAMFETRECLQIIMGALALSEGGTYNLDAHYSDTMREDRTLVAEVTRNEDFITFTVKKTVND